MKIYNRLNFVAYNSTHTIPKNIIIEAFGDDTDVHLILFDDNTVHIYLNIEIKPPTEIPDDLVLIFDVTNDPFTPRANYDCSLGFWLRRYMISKVDKLIINENEKFIKIETNLNYITGKYVRRQQ